MPKKYWKNLSEAAVIPVLPNEAPACVSRMITRSKAQQTEGEEWRPLRNAALRPRRPEHADATPANNSAILAQASSLYGEHKLRRVYYSAFSPILDASSKLPLQAPSLVREHRLYQADWLMRFYGFDVAELTTPAEPDLPLGIDPKLAWALRHREQFPVNINKAAREMLLRVPGLGVKNVDRILQVRRWHELRLADLTRLRVPMKKTLPFIIAADHTPHLLEGARLPLVRREKQLELFAPETSVFSGQL